MHISIHNDQEDVQLDTTVFEEIVRSFLDLEKISADEVSIVFVDTPHICKLHQEFFNDPSTTDCISFPMDDDDDDYRVLGEVFVCPATAVEYTKTHGGDPQKEIALYVIHGLLHLIGLDDIDEKDCKIMREREKMHMENIEKLRLNKT